MSNAYALAYLYKGKHRLRSDPTNYGATTAIAGTIAASALVGLGTTGIANAATEETWDALAECESGQRWDINTGNGYSGGLQFLPSTWDAFRDGQFAESAHEATREQQIVVAERVLDGQGWDAWPACSRRLGLTDADAEATAPTTSTPVPTEQVPTPTPTETSSVPQTESVESRCFERDIPADATTYTVVEGDNLSCIAFELDKDILWPELFDANRQVVQDPDLIYPGEVLSLP